MLARLCAFVIWGLVAATAVFWGLRLFTTAPRAPANTQAVGEPGALRGDLARLFGTAPAPAQAAADQPPQPEAASRFKLIGVMAPRSLAASAAVGAGVALIAVDGKAPKAYTVGARVDEGITLQSVGPRAVSIAMGPGQPPVRLELAPLPMAATGTLPPPRMSIEGPPGAAPVAPPPTPSALSNALPAPVLAPSAPPSMPSTVPPVVVNPPVLPTQPMPGAPGRAMSR